MFWGWGFTRDGWDWEILLGRIRRRNILLSARWKSTTFTVTRRSRRIFTFRLRTLQEIRFTDFPALGRVFTVVFRCFRSTPTHSFSFRTVSARFRLINPRTSAPKHGLLPHPHHDSFQDSLAPVRRTPSAFVVQENSKNPIFVGPTSALVQDWYS
jgi:hypothetical protein